MAHLGEHGRPKHGRSNTIEDAHEHEGEGLEYADVLGKDVAGGQDDGEEGRAKGDGRADDEKGSATEAVGKVTHRTLENGFAEEEADDDEAGDVGLEVANVDEIHRHRGDVEDGVRDLGEEGDNEE